MLNPTAGDPDLSGEHGDHGGQEGELDARVPMVPLIFSILLLQEPSSLGSKMDGAEGGRSSWLRKFEWLALRTIARCEILWIRFAAQFGTLVVMLGGEELQGQEGGVSWDGLPKARTRERDGRDQPHTHLPDQKEEHVAVQQLVQA